MNWEGLRRSKLYDFLTGLPLILWFGYGVVKLRADLVLDVHALLAQPGNLLFHLRLYALGAVIAFDLLTIYMIVVRDSPVRRAQGLLPRLCGFAGTFLGVGILYLKPVALSLPLQIVATFLVFFGSACSVIVLIWLGKNFSIMPEARALVTEGPYMLARHPLYAVEILTLVGTAIQFAQPWSGLLALSVIALLWARTHFEEQVLAQAHPQYAKYQARVRRFGFV